MNLDKTLKGYWERWAGLPDRRKANNNTQYTVADGVMAAFSVFFMQSPSFLAHQQEMAARKGRSNAHSLFKMKEIPSDNQIRNLLDGLQPSNFAVEYDWLQEQVKQAGELDAFKDHAGTFLIAIDGLTFFSSTKVHCPECLKRDDHYYHCAVTPVLVKPDYEYVLPLMPEFVVPQDGAEKQDCERNAAKRWVDQHPMPARSVTYLGDDLYACQPICQQIADQEQYFLCVAKPESHTTLYAVIDEIDKLGRLHHHTHKHWNGRHFELWTFRFASDLPLRADTESMSVNWFEVTVTHAKTGQRLYYNTWITNHLVSTDSVFALAKAGRARWRIENENNNVLKNHGYHLEHNFGHGKLHLSNLLFTLNLLAFFTHTVLELTAKPYQILRAAIKARQRFFNDLRALTRFILFDSWHHLWRFMLDGLEIVCDPALLFSD